MERPVLRLRACSDPYKFGELQRLAEPLAGTYDIQIEEEGEGGGLFGLDLLFIVPALTTVGTVLLKPWIEGAAKRLGEKFVDILSGNGQC